MEMIGFSSSAASTLGDAELLMSEPNYSLIHMDVDHSFLPIPTCVKAAIFESFARQNVAESETDIDSGIQKFIQKTYGLTIGSNTELVFSDSSIALFNKMVLCCIQEGGTLLLPAGINGKYVYSSNFLKANFVTIPTNVEDGFKITGKGLATSLGKATKPWVYICGPTVNPTGLLYTNEEMREILQVCAQFGAKVILDTSFSGLEFDGWAGWNLDESLSELRHADSAFCICLMGNPSYQLLAGGLEFGFLALHPSLVEGFHSFPGLSRPHSTSKYILKKLLALQEQDSVNLSEAIVEHKKILKCRSNSLQKVSVSILSIQISFQHFAFDIFCSDSLISFFVWYIYL